MLAARFKYVGDGSQFTKPLQDEAAAYFARMTTPPSFAFADAFNTFVFKVKALGIWSNIVAMWFFCAETSQAALLNIISSSFTSTVGGSPTFTASKGYSGLSSANTVSFGGIGSTQTGTSPISVLAGIVNGAVVSNTSITKSSTSTATTMPGVFTVDAAGRLFPPTSRGVFYVGDGAKPVVCAGGNGKEYFPSGSSGAEGSSSSATSNYQTTDIDSSPLNRLSVYGFLTTGTSDANMRKFLTALAAFLEEIGALD
jgi:hypothetical protein